MILALRQVSFIQTSSVWLKLLQYVNTLKQAKAYAHSQARARWRAQSLKITIHQLLHYCRLRQCYSVPFHLVIYRSFSSDFDGFSYLPKHSVTMVNPSHIHHIVWDYPVMAIVRMSSQHRLRNGPIHTIQMFLSSRESTSSNVKKSGLRIRIVEKSGMSVKRVLQRSDPFKKRTCERDCCFVCRTGGRGPCDSCGVTYEIKCQTCGQKYVGETARSAFTRGKEHLDQS